jgi:deoxyhypusine synthase
MKMTFETTAEQTYRVMQAQRDQERAAARKLKEQQQTAALIIGGRIIEHVTLWTCETGRNMHATRIEVV